MWNLRNMVIWWCLPKTHTKGLLRVTNPVWKPGKRLIQARLPHGQLEDADPVSSPGCVWKTAFPFILYPFNLAECTKGGKMPQGCCESWMTRHHRTRIWKSTSQSVDPRMVSHCSCWLQTPLSFSGVESHPSISTCGCGFQHSPYTFTSAYLLPSSTMEGDTR